MNTMEGQALSAARELLESMGSFDPASEEDAHWRTLSAIAQRQGQLRFRTGLLAAYGSRCAISTCDVEAVLEAVHILPFRGAATHQLDNGLLLRADLHTLFDCRLIAVQTSTTPYSILVSPQLAGTAYAGLARLALRLPAEEHLRPSPEALDWHRTRAGL